MSQTLATLLRHGDVAPVIQRFLTIRTRWMIRRVCSKILLWCHPELPENILLELWAVRKIQQWRRSLCNIPLPRWNYSQPSRIPPWLMLKFVEYLGPLEARDAWMAWLASEAYFFTEQIQATGQKWTNGWNHAVMLMRIQPEWDDSTHASGQSERFHVQDPLFAWDCYGADRW